jgi:hypothetical protein
LAAWSATLKEADLARLVVPVVPEAMVLVTGIVQTFVPVPVIVPTVALPIYERQADRSLSRDSCFARRHRPGHLDPVLEGSPANQHA